MAKNYITYNVKFILPQVHFIFVSQILHIPIPIFVNFCSLTLKINQFTRLIYIDCLIKSLILLKQKY